jgi:hypothetical protein
MRRRCVSALVAVVVLVAGCAEVGGPGGSPDTPPTQTVDAQAVTVDAPPAEPAGAEGSLWISATQVPPGADIAVAIASNSGAGLFGGVGASVQRWDGAAWQEYGFAGLCTDFWQCAGAINTDGNSAILDIGVNAGSLMRVSTQGLEPGRYRLSMGLFDNAETPDNRRDITAAGQFEVADDAPEPAPLWPLDGVMYSLTPGVLPPVGGQVYVGAVVPSNSDGSQSAEDIIAAVDGQDENAVIEVWPDGAWQPVGDVGLIRVTEGNTWDNTAQIPALPEGAYRLVRSGPHGDQTGSFWVVDPQGSGDSTADPSPSAALPDVPTQYGSQDVASVTMVHIPPNVTGGGDAPVGCEQWTVELAAAQSWHAAIACVTDYDRQTDPPDLTPADPVSLTVEQVSQFAQLIDDLGVGSWSNLIASGQLGHHPTAGDRTILHVHLTDGSWDTFDVTGREPPSWGTFYNALQSLAN